MSDNEKFKTFFELEHGKNLDEDDDIYDDFGNDNENDEPVDSDFDDGITYTNVDVLHTKPYNRSEYLESCQKATPITTKSIDFFLTKTQTLVANTVLQNIYSKNRPSYLNSHYLVTHGSVDYDKQQNEIDKFKSSASSNNTSYNNIKQNDNPYKTYKDMIFMRGRTIPKKNGEKSKNVLAFVKYKLPTYGPKFYIEAREGFDNYPTFSECDFTKSKISPHNLVSSIVDDDEERKVKTNVQPSNIGTKNTNVERFIRWLQNYMFSKKKLMKEGDNVENYSDFSKNIKTTNYVNPQTIIGYSYLENVSGFKTMWGMVPELSEGGPSRYVVELTLATKKAAKTLHQFFEDDEYLNLAAAKIVPTIRTFEAKSQFDLQWRMEHDVDFNRSYRISNYELLTPDQIRSTYPNLNPKENIFLAFNYNEITRSDKKLPQSFGECTVEPYLDCKPIKVAFDLEVNNPIDKLVGICFPTARWTPLKYCDRYTSLLNDYEKASIANQKTSIEARRRTIEVLLNNINAQTIMVSLGKKTKKEQRIFLTDEVVPKLTDVDYISVFSAVFRQEELGRTTKSKLGGFVYTWKPPNTIEKNKTLPPLSLSRGATKTNQSKVHFKSNEELANYNVPISTGIFVKNENLQGLHSGQHTPMTIGTQEIKPTFDISKKHNDEQFHKLSPPINFSNITSNDDFKNLSTRVFETEYQMISMALKIIKYKNPDLIVGHGILPFDLPYLIDRLESIAENNPIIKKELEDDPFTFGIIRGNKSRYSSYGFNRNNKSKLSWNIDSPGVTLLDSLRALQHETFGKQDSVSNGLGHMMPKYLTYSGKKAKMRKLQISILKSSKLWYDGGDGLAYFVGYCLFDALGSIMLMELLSYFDTIYFTAEITGAQPESILQRGAQNIELTMFYKMMWENSKKQLYPDYGKRELHYLDLWYWHYNSVMIKNEQNKTMKLPPKPEGGPGKYKFRYTDVRFLYEIVPVLKRKWQMGGIRLIEDLRSNPKQYTINPYLPKPTSEAYKVYSYSGVEVAKKKKDGIVPKSKAYVGARCFEVTRGYFPKTNILTPDFLSMYPTIAIALCLCFINLVTEFTRQIFNIPRICLIRGILGPKSVIQTGDVMKDAKMARAKGYTDTDELVYCYFYQNSNTNETIFPRALTMLLATRKVAKRKMDTWGFVYAKMKILKRLHKIITTYWNQRALLDLRKMILDDLLHIKETPIGTKNAKTVSDYGGEDCFNKIIDMCKQSETPIKFLNTLIQFQYRFDKVIPFDLEYLDDGDDVKWNLKCSEILTLIESITKRAFIEKNTHDADQLSKKIVLNAGYGVVSSATTELPIIQIGSLITATGQNCSTMVERVIENTDLLTLVDKIDCKKTLEEITGKNLDEIRKRNYGKIYNSVVTNGDTDSIIYALRDEIFPSPETGFIASKKVGPMMVTGVNKLLPKFYKDPEPGKDNGILVKSDRKMGPMLLQAEKTSVATLNCKKKMYIQSTIEMGEQYKGVAPKKTDTNPFAAKIMKDCTSEFILKPVDKKTETTKSKVLQIVNFFRKSLLKLFVNDFNPADFIMKTKLNRPIEAFENKGTKLPDHIITAKKKLERGETINIGDFMSYVYTLDTSKSNLFSEAKIKKVINSMGGLDRKSEEVEQFCKNLITTIPYTNVKDSRHVEDANYALAEGKTLDMLYYLEFKILPKLSSFLSPFLFSYTDYPKLDYYHSKEEKKAMKKLQKKIEVEQSIIAYDVIVKGKIKEELNKIQSYRLQREITTRTKAIGLNYYLPPIVLRRCVCCNNFFHSNSVEMKDMMILRNFFEETKDCNGFYSVCDTCKTKTEREEVIKHQKNEIKGHKEKLGKCLETCWNCIDNTMVSKRSSVIGKDLSKLSKEEIYYTSPSDCTLTSCDVHKDRTLQEYKITKIKQSIKVLKSCNDW